MKRWLSRGGWILGLVLVVVACRIEQTDTCSADQQDGNWQQIVDNSSCTAAQKGEAYLALGGFDYIRFLGADNLNQVLGLSEDTWQQKRSNFDRAAAVVRSVYRTGDDAERTIFLFGTFLGLFTYLSGSLDNGAGQAVPFDGTMTDEEITRFTGIEATFVGGNGSGVGLDIQDRFQIEQTGETYIFVQPDRFYYDLDGDGIIDLHSDGTERALVDATFLMDPARWTAFRRVAHLVRVDNPMVTVEGDDPATRINRFSGRLNSYLSDLVSGFVALGVDRSADILKPILDFQDNLDNGGDCPYLNANPAFRLIETLAAQSRELPVAPGETYTDANVFSVARLSKLGLEVVTDDAAYPDISVDPGLKLLYLDATREAVIPYWRDATSDVREALAAFSRFSPTEIAANDGTISLSEILCLPEKLSP
jgi:hypothetical protein